MRISDWSSDVCSSDLDGQCDYAVHPIPPDIARFEHRGGSENLQERAARWVQDSTCRRFADRRERGAGFVPVEAGETDAQAPWRIGACHDRATKSVASGRSV